MGQARTLLMLALAVAVASVAGAASPIPDRQVREEALGIGVERPLAERPSLDRAVATAAQDDFDVTHYLVALDFDDESESISGSVSVTLTSLADGLQDVVLDFKDNMTVSLATVGGFGQLFTHQNDLLTISLTQPIDTSESVTILISYSGSPTQVGFGTFGWNKYGSGGGQGEMVWSLSEPTGARHWWPCKDRPDDKALVEEWWTVRPEWTATGNGVLLGVDTLGNGRKRYRWRASRPLTTYLVSVAATDYVSFSHSYTPLAGGSMPIDYYVYSEDWADAQVSFTPTVDILEFFAETFGEYPFVEDKYGMSAFPFAGAMEHTTNTSYGYFLIDGTNTYDFINAHEIAHQWWGDSVSPQTWPDIWLNEGFASYSEALWFEHLGGGSSYKTYMNTMYRDDFDGPVYAPLSLFGSTVYNKGAWVVHMLRGVMSDAPFFAGLRNWYEANKDGVGNTAELQVNFETFHGSSLDWFFQQWVYAANRPHYEVSYSSADLGDGTWRNYVRVQQVQTDAGLFTMPVDLVLHTSSGDATHAVWNDMLDQDFVLDSNGALTGVTLDPDDWILKHPTTTGSSLPDADTDGVPDRNDNCPAIANAAQEDFDEDLAGDACDDDDDGDSLIDLADCAPLDPEGGTPGEVASLSLDGAGENPTSLSWTSAVRADSYDVSRGLVGELHLGYGACLAPGVPVLSYDEWDDPPLGEAFLYLVRGRDEVCGGGGSLGFDSNGTPRTSPCQ